MSNECIRYRSIDQFKNLIRQVKLATTYDGKDADGNAIYVNRPLPTLEFNVSTKVHGTNASIRYSTVDHKLMAQSRERVLSLTADNAGFYAWTILNEVFWSDVCNDLLVSFPEYDTVVIVGEWSGKGIQKTVAVSEVDKFFYIFSIKLLQSQEDGDVNDLDIVQASAAIESSTGLNTEYLNSKRIFLGTQFPIAQIAIDFNQPELAQNKMVEMCLAVEAECPVGKYFGVSGVGEGVVISRADEKYGYLTAKIKGEKHSGKSTGKTNLAPVDEEAIAKVSQWVDTYVTEARLQQGIHVMKAEMQLEVIDKNIGAYLRWLSNDVIREEEQSILVNGLDPKKIAKKVNEVGKRYYFTQL